MAISERHWFADLENYKATNEVPEKYTWQQQKHFYKEAKFYLWDDSYLFKRSLYGLLHMCVAGRKVDNMMWQCHNSVYRGHHSGERTTTKILKSEFLWPTLFNDCKLYVSTCPECKKTCNISKRDKMPLNIMLEV